MILMNIILRFSLPHCWFAISSCPLMPPICSKIWRAINNRFGLNAGILRRLEQAHQSRLWAEGFLPDIKDWLKLRYGIKYKQPLIEHHPSQIPGNGNAGFHRLMVCSQLFFSLSPAFSYRCRRIFHSPLFSTWRRLTSFPDCASLDPEIGVPS